MIRGRFAPSPTGDLHFGGARTALAAWLQARSANGALVLRMEDLDGPRVVPGAAARILGDLRALGLDWDEGPDLLGLPGLPGVGGPHAPYSQGERSDRYRAALERLTGDGRIFPCYCSRADIARAALAAPSAPHGPSDEGPRYPGTCRALDREAIAAHERAGRRPSLRFRVDPGEVQFVDGVHGEQRFEPAREIGDFVVRRSDGLFAYQLAVVVDDAEMAISDVVRGDDLLASTARQILLHRALGFEPPHFAHVPLVLGADGQRLAKRHGAIAVRALLDRGVRPERVIGLLASSLLGEPIHEARPCDLAASFSLARVAREPARIDPDALA
jgi:glutamyl-tRNA synthetase